MALGPLSARDRQIADRTATMTPEKFGAVGDGVADDTAAILALIASGVKDATGNGIYRTTASVAGVHDISWSGRGHILANGQRFWLSGPIFPSTDRNTLFCSVAGTGDGLSSARPMSLPTAFDTLKKRGRLLGLWGVDLAAGTYAAIAPLITGFAWDGYLRVRGPDADYGIPTVIIDAAASGHSLYFSNVGSLHLRDIKLTNATGNSVASGIIADGCNVVWADNVHTQTCVWAGINANRCQLLVTYGGIYEGPGRYGQRAYLGTGVSVAQPTRRPLYKGLTIGFTAQGMCYGHLDYANFEDCDTGILVESNSRLTSYENVFDNVRRWHDAGGCSGVSRRGNTGTPAATLNDRGANASYFRQDTGNTQQWFDQYVPDIGANGRRAWGYTSALTPNVTHQFCDGTTAGISLAGFSPATALLESSGNTILALAASGANYSGVWLGDATSPQRVSIRGAAGDMNILFSAAAGYRFRVTDFAPSVDNTKSLGTGALRWSQVFAGNGTISTSDGREKQDISPISDAVLDAWGDVHLASYRWIESVRQKGDLARIHFGVVAQQVHDAFAAKGLDPFAYGLLCYDEWRATSEVVDEDGEVIQPAREAGSRWGIRADQCLFLEAAYQRRRMDRLELIMTGGGND